MSVFSGRQFKGALRFHREKKQQEAAERNARTPEERWAGRTLAQPAKNPEVARH